MRNYLSLVKFSHTIFALPFALFGFFLGVKSIGDVPYGWLLIKVVACMVLARSAAMAFNRLVDHKIDALNPRTQQREIPAGVISLRQARFFVALNVLLFIAVTFTINPLCFYLSPIALLIILGYSYTKRYTALCHMVLGLGLALAPIGSYLAVTGRFDLIPVLYGAAVLLWVAGFDIIYALQDETFDRQQDLKSVPAYLGKRKALWVSRLLHLACAALMIVALRYAAERFEGLSWMFSTATGLFVGLLFYQHTVVQADRLERVNLAFFTTNGIASLIFGSLAILDLWI